MCRLLLPNRQSRHVEATRGNRHKGGVVAAEQDRERSGATRSGSGSTIRPTEAGKASKRRMQLRRPSPRPTSNTLSLGDAACADCDSGAVGLGSPLGTRTVKHEEVATDVGRRETYITCWRHCAEESRLVRRRKRFQYDHRQCV